MNAIQTIRSKRQEIKHWRKASREIQGKLDRCDKRIAKYRDALEVARRNRRAFVIERTEASGKIAMLQAAISSIEANIRKRAI